MWLFTPFGFFSVIQKPDEANLQVRARVKEDLEALRDRYLPEIDNIIETPHGDYRYRALVTHEAFARAAAGIVKDLHYPNFKNEVARQQGGDRAHRYAEIWSILYQLQADHAG